MAGVTMKLACLVLACMIVTIPMTSNAAITCGTVSSSMGPCVGYLTRNLPLTAACCTGVSNLNTVARSTPDRQQACRCLQSAARGLGASLNPGRATGLPGACRVRIPYAISLGTDCSKVT